MGLSQQTTVYVVSFFALLSGVIQAYILYLSVKRSGFSISARISFWTDSVKDIMKNMLPGIIGAGVWQVNLLVDTTISSYLPTGTITCISLADRLNQFPLGTLGIALSTALLPALSKNINKLDYDSARGDLEKGLLFAFFFTFLSATILIALDIPTVSIAFQRGLFEREHVIITAKALVGFAIGLPAYVLTKVFSSVYFACGDTKSPVIFAVFSVLINLIFLIILVPFFKYFGLALCTSLSSISYAIMLICFCNKNVRIKLTKSFITAIFSQVFASFVTYISLEKLINVFWMDETGSNITQWLIYIFFVVMAIFVYCLIVVISMRLLGHKNWRIWRK
jgi:putative peptidoglycan lipid II flippase